MDAVSKDEKDKVKEDDGNSILLASIYSAITNRRITHDNLTWQVPALALTAQAFLLNISLSSATSQIGRTIASVLSILISILSIQLLERHGYFETVTSILIENFEKKNGISIELEGERFIEPHTKFENILDSKLLEKYERPFLAKYSSRKVWKWFLGCFIVASILIIIFTWCFPWVLN